MKKIIESLQSVLSYISSQAHYASLFICFDCIYCDDMQCNDQEACCCPCCCC